MASGAALPAFTVLGAGSPQSCRQGSHRCGGKRRGRCAHGSPPTGPLGTDFRTGFGYWPATPPRRSPDDGVRPLSLHDVAEELDDGVVRHTARPAVCVHLHHAVGALAQMRVLHILDALQLRHHLGRIHQRSSDRKEFCCTAAKDAHKMEHAVGAAGGASGVLPLLRQDPPQGAGDDGVLSRFLQSVRLRVFFFFLLFRFSAILEPYQETHGGGSSLLCRKIVRRIPPCVMRSKALPSPW